MELLGEGLVAYGRDGAVLSCNRAARRIQGSIEQLPSFAGGACGPPLLLPDGSFMARQLLQRRWHYAQALRSSTR